MMFLFFFQVAICNFIVPLRNHCRDRTALTPIIIMMFLFFFQVAICNFIVPLRHHCRDRTALTPIIIMSENNPDVNFLAAISYYPQVYYCIGRLDVLNDLIRAGVTQAETLVIVDKESSKWAEESYMADSGSVVNVYFLSRMFPDLEIITELTYPANMRFLGIHYSQNAPKNLSFSQKKALEATPQDQDLFRPAFVSGSAISTSMLDTLLYQSYVKPYIISVVYLLIGLKQNAGSGTLIFRVVGESEEECKGGDICSSKTFSEYYQEMIEKHFEIPIGIYRSLPTDPASARSEVDVLKMEEKYDSLQDQLMCEAQIRQILKDRMLRLEAEATSTPASTQCNPQQPPAINNNTNSNAKGSTENNSGSRKFVIVNPEPNTKLRKDDIVYLIRPELLTTDDSVFAAQKEQVVNSQSQAFVDLHNSTNRYTSNYSTNQNSPNRQQQQQPVNNFRRDARAVSSSGSNGLTPISEDVSTSSTKTATTNVDYS
ncbi:potassium channel subfamily T member 2-like isoform X2 [Symsagittifera roscoffensis]|uniref:potassium channel subfamily T member 2-like isoform X2 n=1 Tax=Symsagittifera roscoffensis TaxID=84072 RepID=UPI00307CB553